MNILYYVAINNQISGPFTLDQMRGMNLTPDTLVWTNGMSEWKTAGEVDYLRSELFDMPPSNPDYSKTYNSYNQPAPGNFPNPNQFGQASNNSSFPRSNNQNLPPCPPTYLVWSIISIVLCCLITGIIATIYSSKVENRYYMGDYEGALNASNTARTLNIVSLVLGIIGSIIQAIYFLILL